MYFDFFAGGKKKKRKMNAIWSDYNQDFVQK